jgi:hypothetical protein
MLHTDTCLTLASSTGTAGSIIACMPCSTCGCIHILPAGKLLLVCCSAAASLATALREGKLVLVVPCEDSMHTQQSH